jgi:putative ABC transport system ATP-binding protein
VTASAIPSAILSAEGVGYVRDGNTILADVDVEIRPGERVAVVGPSGSGKTTLLAILAGLLTPTSGRVLFDGQPLAEPATRNGLAVVLQGFGLVSLLTAAENIAVALRCAGVDPVEASSRAGTALVDLGLGSYADSRTDQLSGGQQQRVAVARAVALRPRVLLADEPTAQQDPDNRALVMDRILTGTVLVATHDPEFAARCDRSIVLRGNARAAAAHSPKLAEVFTR